MPHRPALPHHQQPINWKKHNSQRARDGLQPSRGTALARRLDRGAAYFQPSEDLVNAINAAIDSRSPLLLTGDPGTGKTQAAWYLKKYFGIPLFSYQVRSESTARDLRYDFDAVAYLRDAYRTATKPPPAEQAATDSEPPADQQADADPRADPRYLKPGPLWQAYQHNGECVLLIDEIDKAPLDFPNDLLQEFADYRFDHPFLPGTSIDRGNQPAPITVITSNGERRLPDPFLRRCVVHHIDLDSDMLQRILAAWQHQFQDLGQTIQATALRRFIDLRKALERRGRPPGAAELLVWLTVLNAQAPGLNLQQLETGPLKELPALECLIKDHEDYAHLA